MVLESHVFLQILYYGMSEHRWQHLCHCKQKWYDRVALAASMPLETKLVCQSIVGSFYKQKWYVRAALAASMPLETKVIC